MSDEQQLPVTSKELSDKLSQRIARNLAVVEYLEKELYNERQYRLMGRESKMLAYKEAKDSLYRDLEFSFQVYKTTKDMDRETMMLLSIIQSLPTDLRTIVADKIKDIIINKDIYIKNLIKKN